MNAATTPTSQATSGSQAHATQQNQPSVSTPDVGEKLEQFDRESRTREFSSPVTHWVFIAFAVLVSLYHMYIAYFGAPPALLHRSLHVGAILMLCFAMYPAHKKASRQRIAPYDLVLIVASASTFGYIWLNYRDILDRIVSPNTTDVVFGALLVVLVIEASRRVTGWALPILSLVFLAFALFGQHGPLRFRHRGYEVNDILDFLYLTNEGIFSTAVAVAASYIFLFVLFGAVLQKSGLGQFFNDIALALAGRSRGGPAKVAVISSGFLGSINGSAIANVVTTGAFTIPLMKKVGFKPYFAGGVEASASVGGQILPPIMGASAFIMAETLGMQYTEVAIAALIPAMLYYIGVIMQVHFRAVKDGLSGISSENLPAVKEVLKERGHLLVPLVILVYMLFFSGQTILFSALLTILATIAIAQVRGNTRMSGKDIIYALADGAKTSVAVSIACACVGIIVGVVTLTGFGVKLANAIVILGEGSLLLSLVLTMIACIILGMGLPSIPAYIITSTMAAPALAELGVEALVAHLFVFYFGLFANITPPVALAGFAAAGLAGDDPMKTSVQAMRLAIAGYFIPFMFVYNPGLLLQDVTWASGALVVGTAIVGVCMLSAAVEGYARTRLPLVVRVLVGVGGLALLLPGLLSDAVGVGILVIGLAQQLLAKRSESANETTEKSAR
ncbi:TRAP transporter permease [Corynebacterium propinquum]|uniref:TRAP transporter permease n=1 Tax=Corynebacterium propinquum TaxID=43769 RepID=UPI0020BF339D|nr:TRAP transporter permease [Corynebacterium propinquum]UQV60249.1 TRAP transporter permease [Corynebacterium propinquum]